MKRNTANKSKTKFTSISFLKGIKSKIRKNAKTTNRSGGYSTPNKQGNNRG